MPENRKKVKNKISLLQKRKS